MESWLVLVERSCVIPLHHLFQKVNNVCKEIPSITVEQLLVFPDASLSDASLSDASLSDASLSDASLSDASLSDASLSDASLS